MPTYQYRCTNSDCGNEFDLVQTFTEPAASECPACGQAVRKVYGSVGVVFRGSGFYHNDSRAENKHDKDVLASSTKETGAKESSSSKDTGGSKESSSSKDSGGSKDTGGSKDSGSSATSSSKDSSGSSGSSSKDSNGSSSSGSASSNKSSAPAAASK